MLTSLLKQIYLQPTVCARIYCTVNTVCHSCCHHREFTSRRTHERQCCYCGFEMTSQLLPNVDFEWKDVTQTKQRRDMRLTSWLTSGLNRVSTIFLCEYDLTWTPTESQVRLGPGPSQVLSQVSSQDCWWIRPQCRIYASVNRVSIGSDNGLSPGRRQAIIGTIAGIDNVNWTLSNKLQWTFNRNTKHFTKTHLKISSAKWRSFCLGGRWIKSSAQHYPYSFNALHTYPLGCMVHRSIPIRRTADPVSTRSDLAWGSQGHPILPHTRLLQAQEFRGQLMQRGSFVTPPIFSKILTQWICEI